MSVEKPKNICKTCKEAEVRKFHGRKFKECVGCRLLRADSLRAGRKVYGQLKPRVGTLVRYYTQSWHFGYLAAVVRGEAVIQPLSTIGGKLPRKESYALANISPEVYASARSYAEYLAQRQKSC